MVKKLVAWIMPSTIFDVYGIPASGGPLLFMGSAMALADRDFFSRCAVVGEKEPNEA